MSRGSRSKSPINELSDVSSEAESDSELPSLRTKADQLARTIEKLKNYKPDVKKRGRPRNIEVESSRETNQEIVPLLESLLQFSVQILKKVEQVERKNIDLESKLDNILLNGTPRPIETSSAPFIGKLYSQAVTGSAAALGQVPEIRDLSSRLDQIEQDSLAPFIKIDGDFIKPIILKGQPKEGVDQRKEVVNLKKETASVIRSQLADFSEEEIEDIKVVGREKKHLKVKLRSKGGRISILKKFKKDKPEGIFVSEYLTRNRAQLLFKLKQLRKKYTNIITAVYAFGGNVCVKIPANSKYFIINNYSSFNSFCTSQKLINSDNNPNVPTTQGSSV